MFESLVGLITPATRQNGGRLVMALGAPAGVNDPSVIGWARGMVVPSSATPARLSQAAVGEGGGRLVPYGIASSTGAATTRYRRDRMRVSGGRGGSDGALTPRSSMRSRLAGRTNMQ